MIRSPAVFLIWLLCPLIAVLAGYTLATPLNLTTVGFIGALLLLLLTPLALKWHHEMLIIAWNSYLVVFFLPGQPSVMVVMATLSLGIGILNRTLRKTSSFIWVPSVVKPLVFLAAVILITAVLTGGFGLSSLGSNNLGGKRYMNLLGAILGYFALTAQPISPDKRLLMASLYFLSGISAIMSDLVFMAGPSFHFLYVIFPATFAMMQAWSQDTLVRFSGFTWGALPVCFFILMRYGIRGLLDFTRPWRLLVFMGVVGLALFGGFRSSLIILAMIIGVQFYFERLYRTRYLPLMAVVGLLAIGTMVLFVDKMPLAVQRSLSFLPIDVHQSARADATNTLDWRLEIWRIMVPEVPKHLLLGKGFSFSGTDYALVQEGMKRGFYRSYEDTLVTGNYHSGPLTIIIPFGIWGVIGFIWFAVAALRVLYLNYRNGDEEMKPVNTFLLTIFVARLAFFLVPYGQFDADMMLFTGAVGLSVTLNHGVRRTAPESAPVEEAPEPEFSPAIPQFARFGGRRA